MDEPEKVVRFVDPEKWEEIVKKVIIIHAEALKALADR
jgi:hypothetical protein